ncbi:hypothetical protein DSECCO2_572140 [anaerobic digester metagenome]
MISYFAEHGFNHNGFVGMEYFRQIESCRTNRIDNDIRGIGKNSACFINNRGSKRVYTLFLKANAAIREFSFDKFIYLHRLTVSC